MRQRHLTPQFLLPTYFLQHLLRLNQILRNFIIARIIVFYPFIDLRFAIHLNPT
jgi:hypothetical protein